MARPSAFNIAFNIPVFLVARARGKNLAFAMFEVNSHKN